MGIILEMGTLPRHNHLAGSLFASMFELFKLGKVYILQEQCMLVIAGKKYSGNERLIDVNKLENPVAFRLEDINKLDFVQPDFLLFDRNIFVQNISTSKTSGIPDLIVEVWSESNDELERDMKKRIYSSSDMCEHWYIEQNSNIVDCWVGKKELPKQNIKHILKTLNGLEFDLRHLTL